MVLLFSFSPVFTTMKGASREGIISFAPFPFIVAYHDLEGISGR